MIDSLFDDSTTTLLIGDIQTKYHQSKSRLHFKQQETKENDFSKNDSPDVAFSQTANWDRLPVKKSDDESQKTTSTVYQEREEEKEFKVDDIEEHELPGNFNPYSFSFQFLLEVNQASCKINLDTMNAYSKIQKVLEIEKRSEFNVLCQYLPEYSKREMKSNLILIIETLTNAKKSLMCYAKKCFLRGTMTGFTPQE
jgi:hypothetical protein